MPTNIYSQTVIDLNNVGRNVNVLGDNDIEKIVLAPDQDRLLRFNSGGLHLTPGPNLITPGNADIIVEAGDFAQVVGWGKDTHNEDIVHVYNFQRKDTNP